MGADHSTASFTPWPTSPRLESAAAPSPPTTTSSRRRPIWSRPSRRSSSPASSPRAANGWTGGNRGAAGRPATTGASSPLGLRGVVHGVNVDTRFFTGNFPSHCSIEAARFPKGARAVTPKTVRRNAKQTRPLCGNPRRRARCAGTATTILRSTIGGRGRTCGSTSFPTAGLPGCACLRRSGDRLDRGRGGADS